MKTLETARSSAEFLAYRKWVRRLGNTRFFAVRIILLHTKVSIDTFVQWIRFRSSGLIAIVTRTRQMTKALKINRRRFVGGAAATSAATEVGLVGSCTLRLSAEGELPSVRGATAWLNSKPLAQTELRRKVVLINFWTYICINWRRSLPHVRAWASDTRSTDSSSSACIRLNFSLNAVSIMFGELSAR
jgi:hypothetical protein